MIHKYLNYRFINKHITAITYTDCGIKPRSHECAPYKTHPTIDCAAHLTHHHTIKNNKLCVVDNISQSDSPFFIIVEYFLAICVYLSVPLAPSLRGSSDL